MRCEPATLYRNASPCGIVSIEMYPRDSFDEGHKHRSAHFAVVLHGEVLEVSNNLPRHLVSGDATLHLVASTHALYFGSDTIVATIETDLATGHEDAVPRVPCDLLHLRAERNFRQYVHGLRWHFAQAAPVAPAWLAHSVGTFAWTGSTRLIEAAGQARVSHSYYDRAFRRFFGLSPCDYRRIVRLRRAAQLLLSTPARLADVASESGFAHQSHFTASFVRQFGVTPGRFRSLFGSNSR
jgi:AraC-like DNA-binding protein